MDKKKSLLTFTVVAVGTLIYNYLKPINSKVDVINDFTIDNLLGDWHQIAHLKNQSEKYLTNVRFSISETDQDEYQGILTAFNVKKDSYITKASKIKLQPNKRIGIFKASFFTRFYTNFHIVDANINKEDILIFGNNLDSMRILSRTKNLPKESIDKYLQIAKDSGFDISNLVWDKQSNEY